MYPEQLLKEVVVKKQSQCNMKMMEVVNADLAIAWEVMTKFCTLVNLGTQTHRFVSQHLIHETMASVMYRLLDMALPHGSFDEAVRLGLLTFSYHVFLQWRDIPLPHRDYPDTFKRCLVGLIHAGQASSSFILWICMVAAVSLFNVEHDVWLLELLRNYTNRCDVRTWTKTQDILKSYMWVPLLDSQSGEHIYKQVD